MNTKKSDAECEEAIKQFAEITATDEAFAHSVLQDVNYDLETALTKYFVTQADEQDPATLAAIIAAQQEDNNAEDVLVVEQSSSAMSSKKSRSVSTEKRSSSRRSLTITTTRKGEENDARNAPAALTANADDFSFDYDDNGDDDDEDEENAEELEKLEEAREAAVAIARREREAEERLQRANELPMEMTMMTWNVDGLDPDNLGKRFTAVLYIIAKINPEVIFLQEVVPAHMPKLMDLMERMYHMFISNTDFPYFCVTLVSKNMNVVHDEVLTFPTTQMGRSAIVVDVEWQRLKLRLINSHLESMAEYSAERKKQFALCLEQMTANGQLTDDRMAIFAGDLNVRDAEVPTLSNDVRDAWLADGGGKNETRFTWDMRRNDNKDCGGARLRFDRVYYRGGPYRQVEFSLHGLQRIRNIHRFPSDHFAVVCRFFDVPFSLAHQSPSKTTTTTSAAAAYKH